MNTPTRTSRSRSPGGADELAELRGWLRGVKGDKAFAGIARRAGLRKLSVSERTLRRALKGPLPTRHTVLAFARGAGADEEKAERLWAAAERAVRPRAPRARSGFVPGRITTRAGLARALRRLKADSGMSLRELVAAPAAAGLLTRSSVHNALTGSRLPPEQWLVAFAAAGGAVDGAAGALVAARRRILAGPRLPAVYPCEIVERADERRLQDEAARPWLVGGDEADEYDQWLREGEEAEFRRATAWVEDLSDEELLDLQQQSAGGEAGRDLRAELGQYLARARPAAAPRASSTGEA
ncbi:hypothetical protein [Streptomyces sp. NPDC058861]|uniref:hypothetical protein n=1 Tax=Streptomyces sp. NPDC058861 TaxID=3346653 RepID=UPI0036924B33